MRVFTAQKDLKDFKALQKKPSDNLGFVPTMGALHVGHASLIQRSVKENDMTVVSIFVNPTQFNNAQDLEHYPKTLEQDLTLLKSISKDIIVYHPSANDLYGENPEAKAYDFNGLENVMEGQFRPGHFNGVGTVLELLFEAVGPTRSYFGNKDFQQLAIVKKLVELLDLNIEIIGCEIYRETNGLAYSSRNERLSKQERNEAKLLFEVLQAAKAQFGIKSAIDIVEMVEQAFKKHPLFTLEYFEIANATNLQSVNHTKPQQKYRAFIAAFANDVRLIDNIALN